MTSQPIAKSRRRRIFEHFYDCVNDCDWGQLDAILLALFVFMVGLGVLASMFVMGHIQTLVMKSHQPAPVAILQTLPLRPATVAADKQALEQKFGHPRTSDVAPGLAQASAAASY